MILSSGIYQNTPLNTSDVPQSDLNIDNKVRSNPLAWKGQFSPQLIQVLLNRYAKRGTTVFDPFLGSGTVLLEAGRAGLEASGTEINPAGVVLSQTYKFINATPGVRRAHLEWIRRLLYREFSDCMPLLRNPKGPLAQVDAEAIESALGGLLATVEERLRCHLLEALVALLGAHGAGLSVDRIFVAWGKLSQLVTGLPYSQGAIEVYHADARRIPLPGRWADLVITSPPYINVFNYHQQYRASMEALNWNLLQVARSEIGSNRKHRGNRFLTVIQYCLDMAQTFCELARVCRPRSRLIFIVGRESMVRGARIFNGEIVAQIGYAVSGFDLVLRQERVFVNRFGQRIFEDILHFSPPTADLGAEFLTEARHVGKHVLEAALVAAPDRAKNDIRSALERLEVVKPSPVFDLARAFRTQR